MGTSYVNKYLEERLINFHDKPIMPTSFMLNLPAEADGDAFITEQPETSLSLSRRLTTATALLGTELLHLAELVVKVVIVPFALILSVFQCLLTCCTPIKINELAITTTCKSIYTTLTAIFYNTPKLAFNALSSSPLFKQNYLDDRGVDALAEYYFNKGTLFNRFLFDEGDLPPGAYELIELALNGRKISFDPSTRKIKVEYRSDDQLSEHFKLDADKTAHYWEVPDVFPYPERLVVILKEITYDLHSLLLIQKGDTAVSYDTNAECIKVGGSEYQAVSDPQYLEFVVDTAKEMHEEKIRLMIHGYLKKGYQATIPEQERGGNNTNSVEPQKIVFTKAWTTDSHTISSKIVDLKALLRQEQARIAFQSYKEQGLRYDYVHTTQGSSVAIRDKMNKDIRVFIEEIPGELEMIAQEVFGY